MSGRVKDVTFTASPQQLATLTLYRQGESDLLHRDGMWFLMTTCEVPEKELNTAPVDFLGIDLGIVNIATTSDGQIMAGREPHPHPRAGTASQAPRATHSSWAFAQLGEFIAYKARRAGVPVVYVDPAYTSRTCAECGYIDKANRASQALFACRNCGFVDHADRNGSRSIKARGLELWRRGAPSTAPVPHPGNTTAGLDASEAPQPVMPSCASSEFSPG